MPSLNAMFDPRENLIKFDNWVTAIDMFLPGGPHFMHFQFLNKNYLKLIQPFDT